MGHQTGKEGRIVYFGKGQRSKKYYMSAGGIVKVLVSWKSLGGPLLC